MATAAIPTENDAAHIARRASGGKALANIRRFPTGLAHWVYDVRLEDASRLVVRLGMPDQRADFVGALHWSETLLPLAVPLPQIFAHAEHRGSPYLVLERFDGVDLGHVYGTLTSPERRSIAEEVCRIQRIVGGLSEGSSYGFLRLPSEPGRESWGDVIDESLSRSRIRIDAANVVGTDSVVRIAKHARDFHSYFSRVRPMPFLDDATTKRDRARRPPRGNRRRRLALFRRFVVHGRTYSRVASFVG